MVLPGGRSDELDRLAVLSRRVQILLAVLAGLVALLWIATAAIHAADAYGDDRTSGSWLVLGERADEGTFYPPLFDGHSFGGTRWMPLPILTFALAHRLGGHGYLPAKLAVYAVGVALLTALYLCLRIFETPRSVAVGLLAVFVASGAGFNAVTTIAGDALALVFALLALYTVAAEGDRPRMDRMIVAAALSSLAVLSKSSAVWAIVAIAIFLLLRREWRLIGPFVGATIAFIAAGVALADLASSRRFLTNLHELSVAGYGGPMHLLIDTPVRLISLAEQFDAAILMLVPLAACVVLLRASSRSFTVFDCALPVVVIVTIGVLADAGTYENHLLEASAVVLVLVGSLWSSPPDGLGSRQALGLIVPAATCVALIVGIATTLKPIAGETRSDIRAHGSLRYGPQLAAGAVRPGQTLLAEDPGIPYELGRRPVSSDTFMLPRIARSHPAAVALLIRKIRGQRFAKIVLDVPVTDSSHFAEGDFGPAIISEIKQSYKLRREVGGRFVYAPR
jgi:hypothetical protein